jgi:carbon storage regulator
MLVLTRRSGESIVIGGEIRIRVLRASGSRVRLGIEAPADVRIVREKADAAPSIETPPARKSGVDREAVTRNVAPARGIREAGPTPRQPALVDRHTVLE